MSRLQTPAQYGNEGRQRLSIQLAATHLFHEGKRALQFETRAVRAILGAIHRFRLGTWRVQIRSGVGDEIDHLADAFRQLGPHLEGKLATFTLADRKSTVARLSTSYEQVLRPSAQKILALSREMKRREESMRILAEMGRLGRPDHPSVQHLINGTGDEPAGDDDPRKSFPEGTVWSTPIRGCLHSCNSCVGFAAPSAANPARCDRCRHKNLPLSAHLQWHG